MVGNSVVDGRFQEAVDAGKVEDLSGPTQIEIQGWRFQKENLQCSRSFYFYLKTFSSFNIEVISLFLNVFNVVSFNLNLTLYCRKPYCLMSLHIYKSAL